jgi:hypothetical protein
MMEDTLMLGLMAVCAVMGVLGIVAVWAMILEIVVDSD